MSFPVAKSRRRRVDRTRGDRRCTARAAQFVLAMAFVASPALAQLNTGQNAVGLKPLTPAPNKIRKLETPPDASAAKVRQIEPVKLKNLKPLESLKPADAGKTDSSPVRRLSSGGKSSGKSKENTARPRGAVAKTPEHRVGKEGTAAARLKVLSVPDTANVPGVGLSRTSAIPRIGGTPGLSLKTRDLSKGAVRAVPGLVGKPGETNAAGGLDRPGVNAANRMAGFGGAPAPRGANLGRAGALNPELGGFGVARINRAVNRGDVLNGGLPGLEGESLEGTSAGMEDEQDLADTAHVLGLTEDGGGTTVSDYRGSEQEFEDSFSVSIDRRGTGASEDAATALLNAALQAQQDEEEAGQAAAEQDAAAQDASEHGESDHYEMTFTEEEGENDATAAEEGDYDADDEMNFSEEETTDGNGQSTDGDDAGCAPGDANCTGETGMSTAMDDRDSGTPDCGADGANCEGDIGPGGDGQTVRVAGDAGRGGPLAADPAAGVNPTLNVIGRAGIDAEHLDTSRIEAIIEDRIDPGR